MYPSSFFRSFILNIWYHIEFPIFGSLKVTRLTRPYPSRQRFSDLFSCQIYDLFIYIYTRFIETISDSFSFLLFARLPYEPREYAYSLKIVMQKSNTRDRGYEIFINQFVFVKIYFIVGNIYRVWHQNVIAEHEISTKSIAYKNKTIVETGSSANFTTNDNKNRNQTATVHNNHK